ncbi:hypothetical protein AAHA92_01191 [Salvia divinorum]|uniref:Uncharacterized protein n=1 Tax=Salvia divinorum TaxID=28513 RepID=A0ABD1IM23_SALDI
MEQMKGDIKLESFDYDHDKFARIQELTWSFVLTDWEKSIEPLLWRLSNKISTKSENSRADVDLRVDGLGKIDQAAVVETIKQDLNRQLFKPSNGQLNCSDTLLNQLCDYKLNFSLLDLIS